VFARNKQRVSAFHQQTLGHAVMESEPSYDLLRGNGCEIVVHRIPRKYAAAIKLAKPVEPRRPAAASSRWNGPGTFMAASCWTARTRRAISFSSSSPHDSGSCALPLAAAWLRR
jgi:hypothetical protein